MKKLNKIFIGFTKDGNERCLYKTYETYMNGVNFTDFVDLETGERFNYSYIDSLRPIKETIPIRKDKKYMTKRKIVKAYKADRENLVDIRRLVIGNILVLNNIANQESNDFIEIKSNKEIINSNVTMLKLNDILYEDLSDSKVYYNVSRYDEKVYNGKCIEVMDEFDTFSYVPIQPKKLVLEMGYLQSKTRNDRK